MVDHEAQTLTRELVGWADAVFGMSLDHVARVEELGGRAKVRLLGHGEIEDPWGRGPEAYRRPAEGLDAAIRSTLPALWEREP